MSTTDTTKGPRLSVKAIFDVVDRMTHPIRRIDHTTAEERPGPSPSRRRKARAERKRRKRQ